MHSWPYSSLRPRAWEELQVHTVYRGQQRRWKTLLWDFSANVKSEWSFHSSIRLHGVHKNSFIFIAQSSHAGEWLFCYIYGWYIITELLLTLKVTFPILYSSSSLCTGDEVPCIVWRYQIPEIWKFVLIISYTFDHYCYYIGNWQFSRYLNWFFFRISEYAFQIGLEWGCDYLCFLELTVFFFRLLYSCFTA